MKIFMNTLPSANVYAHLNTIQISNNYDPRLLKRNKPSASKQQVSASPKQMIVYFRPGLMS